MLQGEGRRNIVTNQFYLAMELLQRAKKEILEVDEDMMMSVIDHSRATEEEVLQGAANTSTYTVYSQANQVMDVLGKYSGYVEDLKGYLDDTLGEGKDKAKYMANFVFSVNMGARNIWDQLVPDATDHENFIYNVENCADSGDSCVRTNINKISSLKWGEMAESLDRALNKMNDIIITYAELDDIMGVNSTFEIYAKLNCSTALEYWISTGNESMTNLLKYMDSMESAMQTYNEEEGGGGESEPPPSSRRRRSPGDRASRPPFDYSNITNIVVNISQIFTNDPRFVSFYQKVAELTSDGDGSRSGINIAEDDCEVELENIQYCKCYGLKTYRKVKALKDDSEHQVKKVLGHHDRMSSQFVQLQETILTMNESFHENIKPLIEEVLLYKTNEKTKKELAEIYANIMTTNQMDAFLSDGNILTTYKNNILDTLNYLQHNVPEVIEEVFRSEIPIITHENYMRGTHLGAMVYVFQNVTRYADYFSGFDTDFKNKYVELIEEQYVHTGLVLREMLTNIIVESKTLITAMDALKKRLIAYKSSIEMSGQFYT